MVHDFLSLKTDPRLLEALDQAARKGVSAKERVEQRVSFVYGSIRKESSVTKEQVREILLEQLGSARS